MLNQVSKFLNGESGVIPGYLAVSTDTTLSSISTTATSLPGELAPRMQLVRSRSLNTVQYKATRSSEIASPTGDIIRGSALFSGPSTQDMLVGALVPGLTHTTNFDMEFIFNIETRR